MSCAFVTIEVFRPIGFEIGGAPCIGLEKVFFCLVVVRVSIESFLLQLMC
jgi:hypothetical protein